MTREIAVIYAGLPSGYSISQILDESTGKILGFVLYKDGVKIGSFPSLEAAVKSAVEAEDRTISVNPPPPKLRM
jgi:hypothetical protein